MISKIKKPVSILLSLIMVFSMFAIVPLSASAAYWYSDLARGTLIQPGDTFSFEEIGSFKFADYNDPTIIHEVKGSDFSYNQATLSVTDGYYSFGSTKLLPTSVSPGGLLIADYDSTTKMATFGVQNITHSFDETTGTLTVGGSGVVPRYFAFTGSDVGNVVFTQSNLVKHLIIDATDMIAIKQDAFMAYTGGCVLENVEINSTSSTPLIIEENAVFYRSGNTVTLTVNAVEVATVSSCPINNYSSPVNLIYNVEQPITFKKNALTSPWRDLTVTFPAGCKIFIPGGPQFTDSRLQEEYDREAEYGEEFFWRHHPDLVEGTDYVLGDARYEELTPLNASLVVGNNNTALFSAYTITDESVNGTVTASVNGTDVTEAAADADVLLTVAPAEGYQFVSISAGDVALTTVTEGSQYSFTMPAKNVTVTAEFEEVAPTYTVTWKNWNGDELYVDPTVPFGETPTYPYENPTRPEDDDNTYTFSNWDPDVQPVTGPAEYKATYTAVPKPHTHGGITFQPWTSTNSLPTTAGNYYLANDVTLSGTWTVPGGTTNLCLNGHGIIRTGSGRVIDLSSSGRNLNIYDCDTETEHKFTVSNPTANGAGVAVVNDNLTENYQTFKGGYITGGNAVNGAGIHVNYATFRLYGGTVIGNSNTGDGGGIYAEHGGSVYIDGGTVSYNQARQGGGIFAPNLPALATIHLNSGKVEKNYATYTGGGVYGGAGVPIYLQGSIVVTENYSVNAAGITASWNQSSARFYVSGSPYVYDNFNANGQSNVSGAYYEYTMQVTGNLGSDCKVGLAGANGLLNYYKSGYSHTEIDPNVLFPYDNNNYILVKNGNNAKRIPLYTITFKNYDDEVLQTSKVISGETPEYNGATPTKPADDTNTYTFAGWKNGTTTYAPGATLPEVTGDTTYTAQFTAKPKTLIAGHSLSLDGNIGINFYLDPSVAGLTAQQVNGDNLSYTFAWADVETTKAKVNVAEQANQKNFRVSEDGKYIIITCHVCAAEMTCDVIASFTLGDKTESETYSVRKYCDDSVLSENAQYKDDTKLVELVKAMLNYGAMAQTKFGINTGTPGTSDTPGTPGKLANEGVTYNPGDVTGTKIDKAIAEANGNKTADNMNNVAAALGAKWFSTSLIYLDDSTLRHYFVKDTNAFNPSDYTGNKSNYYYYVEKTGIPAAELDNLQTFMESNTEKTFKYSPLDFVKGMIEYSADEDSVNLAKSLYWYNQAANKYFA